MVARIDVLWHCALLKSSEHFRLEQTDDGWALAGNVALLIDDSPGHVRYRVLASVDWVTDRASIDFAIGERHEVFEILHAEGEWTINGRTRPDLAGCTDLDLGWTPATNTIPLRRLALGIGEQAEIRAAWIKFPELDIQANEQTYSRLTSGRWRYQSGPYDFLLEMSDELLVLEYGADLWRAEGTIRRSD